MHTHSATSHLQTMKIPLPEGLTLSQPILNSGAPTVLQESDTSASSG